MPQARHHRRRRPHRSAPAMQAPTALETAPAGETRAISSFQTRRWSKFGTSTRPAQVDPQGARNWLAEQRLRPAAPVLLAESGQVRGGSVASQGPHGRSCMPHRGRQQELAQRDAGRSREG